MELIFPKIEKRIIEFWKRNKIFEKSLQKKGGDFVFYEGPPTANAKPGVHHVLARVFKDVVCRYKTMEGKRVLRKAGWDVHGLPVELAVEKELGLKNKKDIEKYGINKFNQKCQESVWKHAKDWTDLTERIGYWLDLNNSYITSDPLYMESVFQILKQIWDKGLLYKGQKVVPYCPRCGTGLSSHELALGYRKIKEPAIYVKFKIKGQKLGERANFLVWTTTPWTLPANVAIAVHPEVDYILVRKDKEYLILAKNRKEVLQGDFRIVKEFKGKKLIGLSYQPLFKKEAVLRPKTKNIYKVLAANFVTTEEGTGLVHIAPAFGQDDMELIASQKEKFPILLTVDEQGKFKSEVKKWKGKFVKEADPLIIDYLQAEGCLFKKEEYEHDYPFCWRCDTPLLYYAKESWFIKATKVKKDLIKNNQEINWIPGHIKEGRFGEWLNELKDWALSRERYWGTPLPVWQCENCPEKVVIGSREDLAAQQFSTNKYFLLRHGEALNNIKDIYSNYPEKPPLSLTPQGQKQVEAVVDKLKGEKIDLIFCSDLLRTKQTAEIVRKILGIKPKEDKRLRELGGGDFNGKPFQQAVKFYNPTGKLSPLEVALIKFSKPLPGGETYAHIKARTLDFIKEIDRKYHGKNILIISHQCPLTMLESALKGLTIEETAQFYLDSRFGLAELRKFEFKNFPYNHKTEIDFHRPYIDEVQFACPKCGKTMKRVPEVIDCWFDSGSMPFSQRHWPFNPGEKVVSPPKLFPADYIAEAIDQTRGWFYTLLSISTLLGFEGPYKNVITLGHVLDEKGQKMSKSKGNIVDPWKTVENYGADALRWYFFTVNQPGDPKLFSERDVDQALKKFIMTLWNSYIFWKTYAKISKIPSRPIGKNILDKWALSRLNALVAETTKKLNNYDITAAARLIDDFVINDLSLWYIRRSRKRFQRPRSKKELEEASSVLGYLLLSLAKLTAPFVPFISEEIYDNLLENGSSVHLEDWPKASETQTNKELEEKMKTVRGIVSQGLKLRSDAGIKVRQPLRELKLKSQKLDKELIDLIKEELNIKSVQWEEAAEGWELEYDIEITADLREEGLVREAARQIQEMRKSANLKPRDKVVVFYSADKGLMKILERNEKAILSQAGADDFKVGRKEKKGFKVEKELKIEGQELWLGLKIIVR